MIYRRYATLDELDLPRDAVVVADANLPGAILEALPAPMLVEAGEDLKTLARVESLAESVLERRSSKPMTIVAVGGGSVGDAVGFLASILWRGVGLWHVPTTLVAMVDSAHGGKTAVNLGRAKNQLGSFYRADRVLIVDEVLETLPIEQREAGLAELSKGLWLGDEEGLGLLERRGGVEGLASAPLSEVGARLMELVERAIEVKLDIVERDPREERGVRTFLNFGHTAAHALELLCGLSHGHAVAWGMTAAARLSEGLAGLEEGDADRLRRHLHPLLRYRPSLVHFDDEEAFIEAVGRDKKRRKGRLRSVLLDGPAEPIVDDQISARRWYEAFCAERARWLEGAQRIELVDRRPGSLELERSKSELNRALVIAHLHPSEVVVEGASRAEDVWHLERALGELEGAGPGDDVALDCGEGGTTLRFLLAVAADRPGVTRLYGARRLVERPHGPLIDALEAAGARIEAIDDERGRGLRVTGWREMPRAVAIRGELSSQFASALALLSAGGNALRLELESALVSRPYFEMTLEMLRRVGVSVRAEARVVELAPGPPFKEDHRLDPASDQSSAAVWRVARFLGLDVEVGFAPSDSLQPDAKLAGVLDELEEAAREGLQSVTLDLGDSPDLVPVLAVAASAVAPRVAIEGVAHLRHKESNRIEQLCEAFGGVGVRVEPTDDGLEVPSGRQRPKAGALWRTFGDHRLAMAGLLLTALDGPLSVDEPWVIAKSYPDLWHHARRVGWSVGE